jgi:hypothetical protein
MYCAGGAPEDRTKGDCAGGSRARRAWSSGAVPGGLVDRHGAAARCEPCPAGDQVVPPRGTADTGRRGRAQKSRAPCRIWLGATKNRGPVQVDAYRTPWTSRESDHPPVSITAPMLRVQPIAVGNRSGPIGTSVPLRSMPEPCGHLPKLRSGKPVLLAAMQRASETAGPAGGRRALSAQPTGPAQTCATPAAVPRRQKAESDASGFPGRARPTTSTGVSRAARQTGGCQGAIA